MRFRLMPEYREERLRFHDLGKLRRRRKAAERGREDGMGGGGAVCTLIKLRQCQRRAEFEAPGLLPLRHRDGG